MGPQLDEYGAITLDSVLDCNQTVSPKGIPESKRLFELQTAALVRIGTANASRGNGTSALSVLDSIQEADAVAINDLLMVRPVPISS